MTTGEDARVYTTRRVDGAWRVIDSRTGTLVSQHGAGPAGATAAASAADRLNVRAPRADAAAELRAWRHRRGLTLKQVAAELGVFWITVQRWETGAISVPPYLHLALEQLEQKASTSHA